MKVKSFDKNNNLVFETEFPMSSPISSYLIENGLKEAPEHYYDNSLEGLNLRLNTSTTEEDIKVFNDNFSNEDIPQNYKTLMLFLETSKNNPTSFSKDIFDEFKNSKLSFFKNLYENVVEEYDDVLDKVESFEVTL